MVSISRNVFPFLSLPGEIRTITYRKFLTLLRQPVNIIRKPLGYPHRNIKARDILRVCHQIRDEAWFYFYQLNHFHFDGIYEMYCFLTNINFEGRQQIRQITVTYGREDLYGQLENGYYRSAWRSLQSCDGLQYFRLKIFNKLPDFIMNHDFVSWYCLLELRGLRKVSVQGCRRCVNSSMPSYAYHETDHPLADQLRRAWLRP